MTEDTILLQRYVSEGDRAALEELFGRHYAAVHRTILHMVHNSFDADDLAQATFLVAVRKSDQFRATGSFRGWLLAMAVNQVKDFRRGKKQKREDPLFDLFQATGDGVDVPATGMRREFEQKLEQALEALPPNLKDPLVLHYYEGMSLAEVATTMALPKSTVQSRVNSAIGRLRETFTQRGWVVMLPTLDRLLPVPEATATGLGVWSTGRRALVLLAAVSAALLAVITTLMWPESYAPRPANVAADQAKSTGADAASKGAGALSSKTLNREGVLVAAHDAMVHGRVVANATGDALVGATVRLFDYVQQAEERCSTDANGAFAFPSTVGRRDAFAVIVACEGCGREVRESVLAQNEAHEVRLATERIVRGRVFDHAGAPVPRYRVRAIRRPVDGAMAMLLGAVPQRLRVEVDRIVEDEAGAFSVGGLSAAGVLLVIDVDGEQPWLVGEDRAVVPGDGNEHVVRLPRGADVRVHVIDKITGAAIVGATMVARHPAGSWIHTFATPWDATAELGVFTMRRWLNQSATVRGADGERVVELRPNVRALRVSAPGYAPCFESYDLREGGYVRTFELEPGGSILGRALDERGQPAMGMRILPMIEGAGRELVISDQQGAFEVVGLPTGFEVVIASYSADHSHRISLAPCDVPTGVSQSLTVGGNVGGAVAGSLRLRGEPVVAADVHLERGDMYVDMATDVAGRFRFDGLPPGEYSMHVSVDGDTATPQTAGIHITRQVQLRAGSNEQVDMDLCRELRGICIDVATGKPAATARVEVQRIGIADAAIASGDVDQDGAFRVLVEGDGAYELRDGSGGYWHSRRNPSFQVAGEQPVTGLRLEVERDPQNASFTMRVLDAVTRKPITAGAYVMNAFAMQRTGRLLPRGGGIVVFDGLCAGRCEVQVHSDLHVDQTFSLDLLPGQIGAVQDVVMKRAASLRFEMPTAHVRPHPSGMVDGDRLLSWGPHALACFRDLLRAEKALAGASAALRIVRGDMQLVLQVRARQIPELDMCTGWMHSFRVPIVNR